MPNCARRLPTVNPTFSLSLIRWHRKTPPAHHRCTCASTRSSCAIAASPMTAWMPQRHRASSIRDTLPLPISAATSSSRNSPRTRWTSTSSACRSRRSPDCRSTVCLCTSMPDATEHVFPTSNYRCRGRSWFWATSTPTTSTATGSSLPVHFESGAAYSPLPSHSPTSATCYRHSRHSRAPSSWNHSSEELETIWKYKV